MVNWGYEVIFMSISEKDIRTDEDIYKNVLYDKIGEMISRQSEIITKIDEIEKYLGIEADIPNIAITFNNKLIEISQIFRNAGISMFAKYNEKYDLVGLNFVEKAIMEDMFLQVTNSMQALAEYDSSIRKVTKDKMKKIKALKEVRTNKKNIFKNQKFPNTVSDLTSFSEEEIGEVNSHLLEYKNRDENLWKYNLRDNVVQSLVKCINNKQYHEFSISELLEESVTPTLQKLGLEDVIPQLQEELSKSQEQSISSNNKSWELSPMQRLEIQMLLKQVANDLEQVDNVLEQNENSTKDKQDKEYAD